MLLDNGDFTEENAQQNQRETVYDTIRSTRFWRGNAGRIMCAVMLAATFIFLRNKYDIFPLILLLLSGLSAILFLSWKSLAAFFVALGFICCTECHFILHYGETFRVTGQQVLLTLEITNSDEVTTYIKMLRPLALALPALFVICVITVCRQKNTPCITLPNLAAMPVFLLLSWLVVYNVTPPVAGYFENWGNRAESMARRNAFQFGARDTAAQTPSLYILVIGESHRQDHFNELLMDAEFAPKLHQAQKQGTLFDFTDVISAYPQTWFSVFTLLTRRTTDNRNPDFPEHGLPWLFREAGYHVSFITYQEQGQGSSGYDAVVGECDEYFNHRELNTSNYDDGIIPVIEKIIAENHKKQLVIIKMSGCHFNYYDRYPARFARFAPAASEEDFTLDHESPEGIEKMRNAYKNAVLASAAFLERIAEIVDDQEIPAMMCFVSDHGITNYDDGLNPYFGYAKSSYRIPLFFYSNTEWSKRYLTEKFASRLRKRRNAPMTNSYVFETFLSLANINYTNGRRYKFDITSDDFTPSSGRRVWVWDTETDFDSLK